MTISTDEYIPTGRTSLIREGSDPVQVQTEYAPNPSPRLTTTVSMSGRVIQKVELKLRRPLASVEECKRAEMVLTRQHTEVVSIIKDQNRSLAASLKEVATVEIDPDLPVSTDAPIDEPAPEVDNDTSDAAKQQQLSVVDRIRAVTGVEYLFHMDNAGNFFSQREEAQFRKLFRKVANGIPGLIEIFSHAQGSEFLRESGIYEVQRDRLYLASTGEDLFFVSVVPIDALTDYEVDLRQAISIG
jgi:hypothetical protein